MHFSNGRFSNKETGFSGPFVVGGLLGAAGEKKRENQMFLQSPLSGGKSVHTFLPPEKKDIWKSSDTLAAEMAREVRERYPNVTPTLPQGYPKVGGRSSVGRPQETPRPPLGSLLLSLHQMFFFFGRRKVRALFFRPIGATVGTFGFVFFSPQGPPDGLDHPLAAGMPFP